jgi:hypothetical protein
VHDARATAHGAVLRVSLPLAPTEIDGKLVGLPAKWALYEGGGTTLAFGHDRSSMAARSPKDDRKLKALAALAPRPATTFADPVSGQVRSAPGRARVSGSAASP